VDSPYDGPSYGGRGSGNSPPTYSSPLTPRDLGSGGGAWDGGWSAGGGAIRLNVWHALTVDGEISADGQRENWGRESGGTGGSILISTGSLSGSGHIKADGIAGLAHGGGGRVSVYYRSSQSLPIDQITANGGGDTAAAGTVEIQPTPHYYWARPADPYFHGVERIEWDALGIDFAAVTADILAFHEGQQYLLGDGRPAFS